MAYLRDIGEKIYGSLYLGDNFAGKLPADLPDLADPTRSNPLKDDDLDPVKQYAIWLTEFPATGALLPNPDGTFTYTPAGDGTETAKYRVLEYNAVVGSEGTITLITGESSVTLVIQDMTSGVSIEVAPLVTGSYLITADMVSALTIEAAPLVVGSVLAGADLTVAASIDAAPLMTDSTLALADLTSAVTIDAVTLSDDGTLSIADLQVSASIDAITLTTDQTLAIADMLVASVVDGATLTTAVALVIADLISGTSIDNVVVSDMPSLAIADINVALTFEALSDFTLDSWLQIQDMVVGSTADNLTLTATNPGLTLSQADIDAIAEAVWAKILTGPRIPGSAGSMLQDTTNRIIAAL